MKPRSHEAESDAGEGAWFVARKDMASNTLWIVRGHDHPWLQSSTVEVADASWIAGHAPASIEGLTAKTRYRQADEACSLEVEGNTDGATFTLHFDRPQRAVTPGQSAVLYHGDVCLGGGIIEGDPTTCMPRTTLPTDRRDRTFGNA